MGRNKKLTKKKISDNFNFIENILAYCPMQTRQAPTENGIKFRISKGKLNEELCILFQIDKKKIDLFRNDEKRPDFLCLYANESKCVLTIIERGGKWKGSYGIKQINSLWDKLINEIKNFLPNKLQNNFIIQGAILTPCVSQVHQSIEFKETIRHNKIIKPIQTFKNIELYQYISTKFLLNFKPKEEEFKIPYNKNNNLETIINSKFILNRKKDNFYDKNFSKKENQIYVNYSGNNTNDYLVLFANNHKAIITFKSTDGKFESSIKNGIKSIWKDKKIFGFEYTN